MHREPIHCGPIHHDRGTGENAPCLSPDKLLALHARPYVAHSPGKPIMRLFRSPVARAALLGVSFALVTPALPLVQPALARSAPESFADLAAKLLPAVVNVSSTQTITAKNGPHGP